MSIPVSMKEELQCLLLVLLEGKTTSDELHGEVETANRIHKEGS